MDRCPGNSCTVPADLSLFSDRGGTRCLTSCDHTPDAPERKSGFHPGSSPEIRQPHPISPESAILDAEAEKQAAILRAEAQKEKMIREAEGQAEAILKVQQANADGLRFLKEVGVDESVLRLKGMEAFAKAADGQATKIIIPSDIQKMAGVVTSVAEIAKEA